MGLGKPSHVELGSDLRCDRLRDALNDTKGDLHGVDGVDVDTLAVLHKSNGADQPPGVGSCCRYCEVADPTQRCIRQSCAVRRACCDLHLKKCLVALATRNGREH